MTAGRRPDAHLGERVVRAYLTAWEGPPEESEPLMAMLRGAKTNDQARTQLRELIQFRLVHGTDEGPDHDDAVLRAGLAAAMLVGVVSSRRIIGVPVLVAPTGSSSWRPSPRRSSRFSSGAGPVVRHPAHGSPRTVRER